MPDTQVNAHNKQEYPPMHTAEHILNQTMVRMFGCPRSRNAHIERRKSKINYILDVEPSSEQVADIEKRVNEIISLSLPVHYEYVERSEVPSSVSLDSLPDDASSVLRLVYVGDYDVCACIGLHVENTSEIGHFHITSTSWNNGQFRIVFKLL